MWGDWKFYKMTKVNLYFINGRCLKNDFLAFSGVRGLAAQSGGFRSVSGHRNVHTLGRAKVAFYFRSHTKARAFAREVNRRFSDKMEARVVRG